MVAYDQLLKILTEKEQNTKTNSDYRFLTIYFPSQNQPKDRLKKELKSFISTALKKNKKENLTSSGKAIVDRVYQAVDNLESLPHGLAFFIKLNSNAESGKKISPIKEEDFIFIPLEKLPQKEVYLGANFDLDQLVWLADKGIDALVLQINQKEANIYTFDDRRLFLISRQENLFLQKREKEYLEQQFSPINFQGLFRGTADDIVAKKEQTENRRFLNSLQAFIKNNANLKEPFDYLIINWSSKFAKLNTSFPKSLASFFPKTKLILIDQNITDPKELEKLVIKKTDEAKNNFIKQEFKEAHQNFDRYREEWPSILAAANEGRIQKLFIQPLIQKQGYVAPDGRLYLSPTENSHPVNNIAPWLVHRVLESSAEIIILSGQETEKASCQVAALLRY